MAQIRKFLDISTAHLSEDDKDYLRRCAEPDSTFGLSAYTTTYGWLVYATDDPACYDDETLPPHMRIICAYARAHGCDYVLFDADAEIDWDLPIYDAEVLAEMPA